MPGRLDLKVTRGLPDLMDNQARILGLGIWASRGSRASLAVEARMALMGCLARMASQEILVLQVGMGVKEPQERWVSLVRRDLWGKKGYQEQ